MKVTFDWDIFSFQSRGGVSRYISRLAEGLAFLGTDVQVVAPIHTNQYLKELDQALVCGKFSERLVELSPKVCRMINQYVLKRQVDKWQPDIIHKTYYAPFDFRSSDSKVVVTVHDMIHEIFPDSFLECDQTSDLKREAVRKADHVICISKKTQQDLVNMFEVSMDKTSVIHHGIDEIFSPGGRGEDRLSTASPFLLYVGARGGYKNFERLLEAYASSSRVKSDFKMVLFGGGEISQSEQVLISKLGLSGEQIVSVSGGDELLCTYYRQAEALIYPSLYEGFGFPPLEAMACGCPVICSSTGSLPEVVGSSADFFDPESTESIRNTLEDFLYSGSRKNELRKLGLEWQQKYTWKNCAESTQSVYREVISR